MKYLSKVLKCTLSLAASLSVGLTVVLASGQQAFAQDKKADTDESVTDVVVPTDQVPKGQIHDEVKLYRKISLDPEVQRILKEYSDPDKIHGEYLIKNRSYESLKTLYSFERLNDIPQTKLDFFLNAIGVTDSATHKMIKYLCLSNTPKSDLKACREIVSRLVTRYEVSILPHLKATAPATYTVVKGAIDSIKSLKNYWVASAAHDKTTDPSDTPKTAAPTTQPTGGGEH